VTDTLGLLLVVCGTASNIGDRDAASGMLRRLRRLLRDITLVWADGGCTGSLSGWYRHQLALALEIVKRTDDMEGFVVLPSLWVAERTFAWLMNSRSLTRDCETLPATSEAMIRWSMITRLSRRLARPWAGGRVGRYLWRRANCAGVAWYRFLNARMKWLLSVKCQSAAASDTLSWDPEAVSASAASSRRRRRM